MKRALVFLVVLAVALAGFYVWWQRNAARVITEHVREQAHTFFVNPEAIEITTAPIRLTGRRSARVPELTIRGNNLKLKKGGALDAVNIVLEDVDIAGPPFRIIGVGEQSRFYFTVTDAAVTEYLHQRGISVAGLVKIPTETISVTFSREAGTLLRGTVMLPFGAKVPVTVHGKLAPSSAVGRIDYRAEKVDISALKGVSSRQVIDALGALNPLVDISGWPVSSEFTEIKTLDGKAAVYGKVRSMRP